LDLRGISITSLPDNLQVGRYLDLEGTSITSLPDNLQVGRSLDLRGTSITKKEVLKPITNLMFFEKGNYILADCLFTKILSKKGNIYKVKEIGKSKQFYLVTDGKFTHSHGDTLKKAKSDFEFKIISEKLKKEPINADTIIDINYYRLVTGACELGVKQWIESNNISVEKMRADKLLPILEKTNAYGIDIFKQLINF
jgi:hypothetical protein